MPKPQIFCSCHPGVNKRRRNRIYFGHWTCLWCGLLMETERTRLIRVLKNNDIPEEYWAVLLPDSREVYDEERHLQ